MATKRDYYEVLGIARDAGDGEVSASYRKLAIKYHPDSNPGDEDATALFKEAAEAYEVLGDAHKRARYDQFGHAGVDGSVHQYSNVEDIFEAFGDIFGGGGGGGGIFGDIFGGGRRRRVRRGADVQCEVQLTLEEAAKGVTKSVEFPKNGDCDKCRGTGAKPGAVAESCRTCGGRGQVVQSAGILRVQTTCPTCQGQGSIITDPCKKCRGRGVVATPEKKKFDIPAGVDDGTRVRLAGEGQPSREGGPPGDFYCYVHVAAHPLFGREGRHLLLRIPISYSQAALGATIEVPTLNGPTDLKVPAGTQSGKAFRLRGQGVADPHGARPLGDLLVETYIETPKKLNPRQAELLRELAELEHTNVTPERKSFLEQLANYLTGKSSGEEKQAGDG